VSVERVVGGRNLLTPHDPESYPGLLVVRPGPRWEVCVIVPNDGETIVGRGGEETYAYATVGGGRAGGFSLRPGDRATLLRSGLSHSMVEWRIERA
jgi:hypothetical protein